MGRVWREVNLEPHRSETFEYSSDPEPVAKVTDVVGLSLDPPERPVVLSVDEKTQVQALHRTQPLLPRAWGPPPPCPSGTPARTSWRSSSVARAYPTGEVHPILDNVSSHKTPAERAWLQTGVSELGPRCRS